MPLSIPCQTSGWPPVILELSDSQLVFGRRDLRAVAGFFLFEGGGSRLGFDSPIDFPDWCWPLGQFKMSHITSRTLGFRPFGLRISFPGLELVTFTPVRLQAHLAHR